MSTQGTPPPDEAKELLDSLVQDGRVDIPRVLHDLGVQEDEVERAAAAGTLELLALERILEGSGRRYDVDEIAAASGLDQELLRALWRSLGFPEPRPGEKIFSDTDLEMLEGTIPFLAEDGLDADVALQMTRVIGSSVAKVANAQVDAIVSQLEQRRVAPADVSPAPEGATPPPPVDHEVALRLAQLLPMMPEVMTFVWRRHLANAARRRMMRAGTEVPPVCVGFADLVGFTAQTQQLDDQELAQVVGRFEKLAHDIVAAHGGRVVKMIGDEVLFVADDVPTGARIALAMAEAYRHDEALSDVRVGLAAGSVLERDGDVYGPVVNLANRVVAVAFPGSVVVTDEVVEALRDDESMVARSIRSHRLKDIGKVKLSTLRPAEDPDQPERTQQARRRAVKRREFLLERRLERERGASALSQELAVELPRALDESFIEQPTEQIEAITEAVLASDVDEELQVELLAGIDAARRLGKLELDAVAKAREADEAAERKIREVERNARRKVEDIESEARRRVEAVLGEAETKVAEANEEAARKVRRVADEVHKQADQVEKEAHRTARRRTRRKGRGS